MSDRVIDFVTIASGYAQIEWTGIKASATNGSPFSRYLLHSAEILSRLSDRGGGIRAPGIQAKLPNVTDQIEESVRIRAIASHRHWSPKTRSVIIRSRRRRFVVAPRVFGIAQSPACGEFPFRFGWEALTEPCSIGNGGVPGHKDDRQIGVFLFEAVAVPVPKVITADAFLPPLGPRICEPLKLCIRNNKAI